MFLLAGPPTHVITAYLFRQEEPSNAGQGSLICLLTHNSGLSHFCGPTCVLSPRITQPHAATRRLTPGTDQRMECRPRGIAGPSRVGQAAQSRSSSDTAEMHAPHAIQSLAQFGHSDMDSANWTSAEPSAVSTADQKRPAHGQGGRADGAAAAGAGTVQGGRRATDGGAANAEASASEQHTALPRQQAHSFGFDVSPQSFTAAPYGNVVWRPLLPLSCP